MSSDAENYRIAKEQQDVFRDAIKSCMEGNISDLNKLLTDFLSKNSGYTAEEFFTGFQSEGRTLLHIAASSGRAPVFEYIIEKCKNPKSFINNKDNKGFTPLMNATISENDDIMSKILQLGGDVNLRNNDGASAMHFAAGDGSVKRMNLLYSAGAKLDELSQSGSPLHWAAGKGRSDAMKFLIDKLNEIYKENSINYINQVNKEGLPAVLLAAVASCDLGVSYLVQAGADIGHLIAGNLTTLHICAEHGLSVAVNSIINTTAGLECCSIPTAEGNTPLHLAAMAGHKEVIKLLIPHSDLSYLSTTTSIDPTLLNKTIFSDKTIPINEILLTTIINEGKERMKNWELKQQNDTINATKESENTEFHKISKETTNTTDITEENKKAADDYKEIGNNYYKKKEYQLAIDAYTDALYLNKFNETYWGNRSACYLALNQPTKALKDAEICRNLNPNWVRGCYRLAAARLALGLYEDSAVSAFEGVKLDENSVECKTILQKAVKLGQEEHKAKIAAGKC